MAKNVVRDIGRVTYSTRPIGQRPIYRKPRFLLFKKYLVIKSLYYIFSTPFNFWHFFGKKYFTLADPVFVMYDYRCKSFIIRAVAILHQILEHNKETISQVKIIFKHKLYVELAVHFSEWKVNKKWNVEKRGSWYWAYYL